VPGRVSYRFPPLVRAPRVSQHLRPAALVYLTLPPLLWASNAIVGRLAVGGAHPLISPLLLNLLRWAVALAILAVVVPFASRGTPIGKIARASWRIFALYGLLAVASYNALQYMALRTSTAINVTLIAAGGPLFVLLIGRLFFHAHARRWAWIGACLSIVGVIVVLTGGDVHRLAGLRLAAGDLLMVAATIVWALYSWTLREHRPELPVFPFLMVQTAWGVLLSVPVVGAEWLAGDLVLKPGPGTVAVVLYVALGPSLVAYWCWDRGIANAGPLLPSFFANLTPLFAALMSAALLGEPPHVHHAIAFLLIVGGIALSRRGARMH
jgi:drug/metabolite transporter (DMT)-like permease